MKVKYAGLMKSFLFTPNTDVNETLPGITFTADDIANWSLVDVEWEEDWRRVASHRKRTEDGVSLSGGFEELRRIDNLTAADPGYWAPLSSLGEKDERFPIDAARYCVVELTYRCTSANAMPAILFIYDGGHHLETLPATASWETLVTKVSYFAFPRQITGVSFRLYSPTRSTESFEIQRLRFREPSPEEAEALDKIEREHGLGVAREKSPQDAMPKHAQAPMGVVMDAECAKRLAETQGITFEEYWELALEDVARHYQNAIILENAASLTPQECAILAALARKRDIRFAPQIRTELMDEAEDSMAALELRLRPFIEHDSLLAIMLARDPAERDVVRYASLVRDIHTRFAGQSTLFVWDRPNTVALYAGLSSAVVLGHAASHNPWGVRELVNSHYDLLKNQDFWVMAPAYVRATNTPKWSTCPEMRLMVHQAFASGADGFFVNRFHSDPIWSRGVCQRSLTGPFLAFSDLWSELSRTLRRLGPLTPLLMGGQPIPDSEVKALVRISARDTGGLPDGIAHADIHRLDGGRYQIYSIVSNEVREMTTINLDIPPRSFAGIELYDLTDFVQTRAWMPMDYQRHMEMFPGRARFILAAESGVSALLRDEIADSIIRNERRQFNLDLDLARTYELKTAGVETMCERIRTRKGYAGLQTMASARDQLFNLLDGTPALSESRTQLIETTALLCACDGALCRLMNSGRSELAETLGLKVFPLAREMAQLRLEWRRGNGGQIKAPCEDLIRRGKALLARIREAAV